MHFWLIKDGENLPLQENARKMRTWMLAEELVSRGHSVVWWAGSFSHQRKVLLSEQDVDVDVQPGFSLSLLYAGRYRHNVSLARYFHHWRLSRRFGRRVIDAERPDAIVCAFPTIDLARAAVLYAKRRGIPIIIDVRDLWPDTFLEACPGFLRSLCRWVLGRDFRNASEIFQKADSIVAISSGCLNWGMKYAGRNPCAKDKVFYPGYPERDSGDHADSEKIRLLRKMADGRVVFLFLGSFGHSYELKLICNMAKGLHDAGYGRALFVLAGEGDQFKEIVQRSAGLPNVSLPGWLDRHEIYDLMCMADVGLAPCRSVIDAMPNKVVEYLSAGLPLLSSVEGELETILKKHDAGFSYKPGDGDALMKHVMTLSEDEPLRRRQAENAGRLFRSTFVSNIVFKQYADHVEAMAG